MRARFLVLIMTVVAVDSITTPAVGQSVFIDCQEVARTVTERRDPVGYSAGLANLRTCPGVASVLVEQLRNPPTDSVMFLRLTQASARARTRDVTDALLEIASSEATPRRQRFEAIAAVASHFRPCLRLVFWPVTTRLWRTYVPVGLGHVPDVDQTERVVPGVPELILKRLEAVKTVSSDAIFSDAVRSALLQMRLYADAGGC